MKNYDISLKQFLNTGLLGPLGLNLTRHEVVNLLGEPPNWGISSDKTTARIWKYGILQMAFSSDQVWYIGLYPEDNPRLPGNFRLTGYFVKSTTDIGEFEQYLKAEHIDYTMDLNSPSRDCMTLATSTNTHAYFNEDRFLDKIIHSRK